MEHWVLEPDVLKEYAIHYQTGKYLPTSWKKPNSSFNAICNIEFLAAALPDMDYHMLTEPKNLISEFKENT